MKQFLRNILLIVALSSCFLLGPNVFSNDEPVYTTLRSIDVGTYNEYRYKMTEKFFELREYFEIHRQLNTTTLSEMTALANTGYRYLPDNLKNKNYLNELLIDIQRGIQSPTTEVAYTEIIKSLAAYIENVEISEIQGDIEATPKTGNAPLSVTFRGKVQDPTGTQIKEVNYTWWIDDAGNRVVIGRGTSLNHTFTKEGKFSVFLDVTSSHRNAEGYTDVLPFRKRVDIEVQEKIASVILKVNGERVEDGDYAKFTPENANYGLIFDATSSIPSDGTQFTRTTWNFGNGVERIYAGGPKIERVRYGNQGEYIVSMELETNEGKKITSVFNIYVHDPIATIDVNKTEGYIGDTFTFTAKSSGIYRDLTYSWELINIDTDEIIASKNEPIFSHSFIRKGRYNIRLRVRRSSGEIDEDTRIIYVTSQAPIAEFESSIPHLHKPNRVYLDASRTYDPDITDDGNLRYSWFIDGTRVNLEEANKNGSIGYYTFDSVGSHSINLEVTDPDGITSTKKSDVRIDSLLSVEIFAFPRVIQRENFIKFVAESPEASVYEWDFGDGNRTGGNLDKVTHTYNTSGTFDVTLTVSDDDNNTNTFTRKVYVSDSEQPLALIDVSYGSSEAPVYEPLACGGNGAYIVDRVNTYRFDGTESINIDGTNTNLEYSWRVERSKFATASTVSHRFDEIGCFPVKLTVKGSNGSTHASEILVDVRNVLPTLASLSVEVEDEEADPLIIRVTAEGANDPDGVIQSYLWYYYTDVDTTPQDFRATSTNATSFVIPKITGNYYFVAILKDNNEARITSEEITGAKFFTTITGDNVNTPIVELRVNDSSVEVGEPITFTANVKNILGQDIGEDAEYSWDFDGDGFYDTQTSESTTSYAYKKSGEFYAKVKVKYRGISSTKNVTINVSNKLVADFGYISIGNKFIFFDTSSGQIESRSWSLGDGTEKSGTYFEYTYTDGLPTHSVTLKISEGSKVEEVTKTVQKNIRNILKSRSGDLVVFSDPLLSEDNTITLETESEKVFFYLGESSEETDTYSIDYDTTTDSDLNGGADDDSDNINTASYRNGDIVELPLDRFKTQEIRIFTKDAEGGVIDSIDITIIKNYVEEESINPDDIIFDQASESEKQKIEALKQFVSELPQNDRLTGMNFIQKLQENWNDATEKTRTILDFENFIFELGLEPDTEDDIIELLESLLVEGQEDQSGKQITYQALVNLIPQDVECPSVAGNCYETLIEKLDEIRGSDDIEANKALGSELLSIIQDVPVEQMSNKQKLDFKAILTSLVYGGDPSQIPDDEREEIIDETPTESTSDEEGSGLLGLVGTIAKILLYVILFIGVAIGIFLIYYKLSNKDGSSFRDFVNKKTQDDDENTSDDILSDNLDSAPEVSDVVSAKTEDVLGDTKKDDEVKKPEPQKKDSATATNDEVPDWLKANFEAPKSDVKKQQTEKPALPASTVKKEEKKTDIQASKIGDNDKKTLGDEKNTQNPKKEALKIPNNEVSEESFDIEKETALPKPEDNAVPDWLKGSFDDTKTKDTDKAASGSTSDTTVASKEDTSTNKKNPNNTKKSTQDTKETTKTPSEKNNSVEDANVPDWLKGSFDAPKDAKKEEKKQDNTETSLGKDSKKDTASEKKVEAKASPKGTKTQAVKEEAQKESPARKTSSKTPASSSKKKTNDATQEKSNTKQTQKTPNHTPAKSEKAKDELWDDGMKIPDWLKNTDDK